MSVAGMTDLLSSVIAAHGGLDRRRTVRAIVVTFNFSGGPVDTSRSEGLYPVSRSRATTVLRC